MEQINNLDEFAVVNILDLIDKESGEKFVKNVLSTFSSPNKDIESFLKDKAVDFSIQRIAITYLVFSMDKNLVGFFSISIRSLLIPKSIFSKTKQRKMRRFSIEDASGDNYVPAGYLIAQFVVNKKEKCVYSYFSFC